MNYRSNVFNKIGTRILLVLLVLFIIIAIVISLVNNRNITNLYEESYTERLLLANALMGYFVQFEDIEYFVDLMKNQDDDFKKRQVDFYHDREELFRLQREGASEEEQEVLLERLAKFHDETQELKNEAYWDTLDALKELKEISHSTYVYVMADTGIRTRDGETLFTYIFDAEDEGEYSSPDMDGLGTSDVGNEAFENVFKTKEQTEKAEHYEGDFGELYFVCVPILNDRDEVIAVLGTDLSLDAMNRAIAESTSLFNGIIIVVFLVSVITIFILLNRRIARPLGSLTKTAIEFAEGNLHTPISESALKQSTEIGALALAFKSTLDATTLYLNSVPESIFIMSRNCETYFRNKQFIKLFGNMKASEFMAALFPQDMREMLEASLKQEDNNSIVWINDKCFVVMIKEIVLNNVHENSILVISNDITDLMNEKENAQAAAAAKSNFLSRMSHEMRTPMNAIIGMAKVAGDSDNITNIKHCISTINISSEQLLGIINDVLDMSKIEAGKLELEDVPVNIEKTLMKVCNMVIDPIEKKNQKFSVVLANDLKLHYMADDLRLSQVLTNILSNAVKFTPEGGSITLTVDSVSSTEEACVLRFAVSDTGIGMTEEQISKLFNAFEQGDGGINRKFGGTGLGLVISQSIIEKMGGEIEVKSEPGVGTTFCFTATLKSAPQGETVIFDGICPGDIRLLVVENDDDTRERFMDIVGGFGMNADAARNTDEAVSLLDEVFKTSKAYDIIFLSYEVLNTDGMDMIDRYKDRIDKNTVIIITTYTEWHRIEKYAHDNDIMRYIAKPLFPSAILDEINDIIGGKLKSLDIKKDDESASDDTVDFSGVKILLAEDIEINREIFFALLEGTGVSTDIAENGLEAVIKFKENPELYDKTSYEKSSLKSQNI